MAEYEAEQERLQLVDPDSMVPVLAQVLPGSVTLGKLLSTFLKPQVFFFFPIKCR